MKYTKNFTHSIVVTKHRIHDIILELVRYVYIVVYGTGGPTFHDIDIKGEHINAKHEIVYRKEGSRRG